MIFWKFIVAIPAISLTLLMIIIIVDIIKSWRKNI